eukprot:UC4_evm4s1483
MILCSLLLLCPYASRAALYSLSNSPEALGLEFRGIGAQSTAGTSRLLFDYPEKQQGEILDYLFKPNFGAALQHFKNRGYEHWLMKEAKLRNPNIELLALVYAWPSWISPNSDTPWESNISISNAVQYVVDYVSGLHEEHNLQLDWVGCWNEREYSVDYITQLRKALDSAGHHKVKIVASDKSWDPISTDFLQNESIRKSVDALSQHYPNKYYNDESCPKKALQMYGVPLYSTEDYSCFTDNHAAAIWASRLNSNYISGSVTFTSAWHMISAFYPSIAFWNQGMMSADNPWSGNYKIQPTIWITAHTTQFTRPGMRYIGNNTGNLPSGGTFVALTDGTDLSIIIEKARPGLKSCIINYNPAIASENITFKLEGNLRNIKNFAIFKSKLDFRVGASTSTVFQKQNDIPVVSGSLTIFVEPDYIYTISTIRTAGKGKIDSIPLAEPFPLPYFDDFEDRNISSVPRYLSDMQGGFEIYDMSGQGKVLRQSVPKNACCNFINKLNGPRPITIIGSSGLWNVALAVDIFLPDGAEAFLGLRGDLGMFFQGGMTNPTGNHHIRASVDVVILFDDYYNTKSASGFAVLGSSWHFVGFDNLQLNSTGPGFCNKVDGKPVLAACGEPETDTKWAVTSADEGIPGPIYLESNKSLCLTAVNNPATSIHESAIFSKLHAKDITVSSSNKKATWPSKTKPGKLGCDTVTLMHNASYSYWVEIKSQSEVKYLDIGFCDPHVDLSGKEWLGWQENKAWVYRANGLFKDANGGKSINDQGTKYGSNFGSGSNVTVLRHSDSEIEFLLDNISQGRINLSVPLPQEALGCISSCNPVELSLEHPNNRVALEVTDCTESTSQLFNYSMDTGLIRHVSASCLDTDAQTTGPHSEAYLSDSCNTNFFFSPDTGYILKGDMRKPMCLALC